MYCQKYSCNMNEASCRARQTIKPHDIGCQDCEQGKEVMRRYNEAQGRLKQIESNLKKKDKPTRRRGRPPGSGAKRKGPDKGDGHNSENKPRSNNGNRLVLDFSEHGDLFDNLKRVAGEDLRTIENQALFILKQNVTDA